MASKAILKPKQQVLSAANAAATFKVERASLELLKKPLQTLKYFIFELVHGLNNFFRFLQHRFLNVVITVSILVICYWLTLTCFADELPSVLERGYTVYYWIILGVLSSVGLGSGLHTFILFVLPYIGAISKKITECGNCHFIFPPLLGLRAFLPTGEHMMAWHLW